MDFSWLRLKRKKKEEKKDYDPLDSYYEKKTLNELVQMYNMEERWLKHLANQKNGQLTDRDYKDLKRIEDEIIRKTPDEFEKKILRILADGKFKITDLMNKKWNEETKNICRDICHYLRFGNIYPIESHVFKPLPVSGHELFAWLLSKAGEDKKDRTGNIFNSAGAMLKGNRILECGYSEDRIRNENLPPIDSIFGRLIVTFMGEYAVQVSIIIEIWKIKGGEGEKYLQEILKEMP